MAVPRRVSDRCALRRGLLQLATGSPARDLLRNPAQLVDHLADGRHQQAPQVGAGFMRDSWSSIPVSGYSSHFVCCVPKAKSQMLNSVLKFLFWWRGSSEWWMRCDWGVTRR